MCTWTIRGVEIGAKHVFAHANDRLMSCVEIAKPHTPRHSNKHTHTATATSAHSQFKKWMKIFFVRSIHKLFVFQSLLITFRSMSIFSNSICYSVHRCWAHSIDAKQWASYEICTWIRLNIWYRMSLSNAWYTQRAPEKRAKNFHKCH